MRKLTLLTLLSGLLCFSAMAQNKIEFREFTLDNGLKVIMHQDNSVPIVATYVLYHVGAKNENPERTGFAHFFEHLLFEGTENIPRGKFMEMIQSAGGTLNASTSWDFTDYYQIMPSNQLELALYMESERLLHAKIDQVGVETQREVVKEEKRMRIDNQPYGGMLYETMERAFSEHPYRWAPIGSMDHLNAATLEEFMEFYEHFYVPNNAVLSIAGDFEYDQAEEWIRMYFEEIPKGDHEIRRPNVTEPKKSEEIRDVVYDNIQIPAVIQAYNMPAKKHEDNYAIDMLSTYLTGGKSSLLHRELVENQQKALQVGAFPLDLEDGGAFMLFSIANMGVEPGAVESEIDNVIRTVQQEGISESDFQKLQNMIENRLVSSNATMSGVARNLAQAKILFEDADYVNQELDRYRKVTREDIQRVANDYLNLEGRVVLHYLPKPANQPAS
jgi:zinc protease